MSLFYSPSALHNLGHSSALTGGAVAAISTVIVIITIVVLVIVTVVMAVIKIKNKTPAR